MKIPHIVFCILFFVSCSNQSHYSTLQQADSLMNQHLDSAYQLIKDINPNDLSAKDKAYHSLLLTTAQYKKMEPIESDSLINIAVEYYSDHFDQDKLTRALMYKGGVMADLHYNKLALESYKEAAKVADTTDFMTMGLLNFRMGELYQKSYINNDEHIKRYKLALKYFHQAKHDMFENDARVVIGQLYATRNYDSAYVYLDKALSVAHELDDKQRIANCSFIMSKFYDYHNTNIDKAKDIALIVYQNRDSIIGGSDIYSHLSTLYSKLGEVDSATYFYKQCPPPLSSIDTIRYCMMQEELAVVRNDYQTAYKSQKISNKLADIIVKQGKSAEYYAIDKEFDNQVFKTQKAKLEVENNLQRFLLILTIFGLLLLASLWYFYSTRKKRILIEKEQFIDNLQSNLQYALDTNLKYLNQGKESESELKGILEKRIAMVKNLLSIKHQYGSNPDVFFSKFNDILSVNYKSEEDCEDIINVANSLCFNVINHIKENHSGITVKQMLLLSLVCLKFSPIEMLVFLNLNSMTAVYNLRSRLIKKLDVTSLEEYVNEQILILSPKS